MLCRFAYDKLGRKRQPEKTTEQTTTLKKGSQHTHQNTAQTQPKQRWSGSGLSGPETEC